MRYFQATWPVVLLVLAAAPPGAANVSLIASTYLGGAGFENATSIAVDNAGYIYIAGWTDSTDLRVLNAFHWTTGGSVDAFVAKLSADGRNLIYCTYLGGSGDDRAFGLAVDGAGNAYVAGSTTSVDFPAHRNSYSGGKDGFLAKLNSSGAVLEYSTYFGGAGSDTVNGITADTNGNVYIVGTTTSANLPVLKAFQSALRGASDGFVAKFDSSGNLCYSTYLGGGGDEVGNGIAVDGSGAAYVTGGTTSIDFPAVNAFQKTSAGNQDVFVAKLAPNGSSLIYSTYLGGRGGTVGFPEAGAGIAVDAAGMAYVTGTTSSPDFPLVTPLQSRLGGGLDAFVSILTAAGSLGFSTFFGGTSIDMGQGISVDTNGNIYLAGYTASTDFPLFAAYQGSNAGFYDGFLTELSGSGHAVVQSTYFGGDSSDAVYAVKAFNGAVYMAGQTQSINLPLAGAVQGAIGGPIDAFLTVLAENKVGAILTTPVPGTTLTETSAKFQWTSGMGIDEYFVYIGSTLYGYDIYICSQGQSQALTLNGLPTDGRTLYIRLWSRSGSEWFYHDYIYKAATSVAATIISPATGTTLSGPSVPFRWTPGAAIDEYFLYVGSTLYGFDLYFQSQGQSQAVALNSLPTDGRALYIRLWSRSGTNWFYHDYTYKAATSVAPATIITPAAGISLNGPAVLFQWTPGTGINEYFLYIGTTLYGFDLYYQSQGQSQAVTVNNLPTDGRTLYIRLWSRSGTNWFYNDYRYNAAVVPAATIISPATDTTLSGSSVLFQWTSGIGINEYFLYIGSTLYGYDLYFQSQGSSQVATVNNLPTDGRILYVRLWSRDGDSWFYKDYTYRAGK
jgi:hypothetical protein